MEESLEIQKAHVVLTAIHQVPAGNAWHINENVKDGFEWDKGGVVSYSHGFDSGNTVTTTLKDCRVYCDPTKVDAKKED